MASLPTFTSDRERRLWALVLVIVVAIYSTLGLARTLADTLRERGWVDEAFWLAIWLVIATAVVYGLTTRPRGAEIAGAIGIIAVYLLVFLRMVSPEERSHMIEYGVLAVLIYAALLERRRNGRQVRVPALLAIGLATAIGIVDEVIQLVIPSRVFDWVDIGFNALSAAMAMGSALLLAWIRGIGRRRREREPAS